MTWMSLVPLTLVAAAQWTPTPPACVDRASLRSQDAFVACARAATEKYADHAQAVLDGYRLIGGDFPAMGEHWIRISLVFDGTIDPRKPEVLQYVTVNGRKVLAGLAYAMPLLPGETAPEWPAGVAAWHDHTKSIEDETRRPHHHGSAGPTDSPRLAMLHVWTTLSNPDGVFAPDNWALSYTRLGLPIPPAAPIDAAKALALVDGAAHFSQVINTATESSRADAVGRIVADTAAEVTAGLGRREARAPLSQDELRALARTWSGMWLAVDALFPPDVRMRLQHSAIR